METLGNYILLETIAQSGPSSVYVAEHKTLRRKTFLKVYSGADASLIDRFEREARIVAELDDDAIVQIYDFGEIDSKYFISMEYVEGANLGEYLESHSLTVDEIIDFTLQIARAVEILHRRGYIHRDLKPANILVDRNNKIKLTDFGITLHESLDRITSQGALLGTPMYMSPEQINNLEIHQTADVFALGIIFYQMATGIHPFQAEQYGEVFARILTHEPPKVHTVNPEIPLWFSDMVYRAMHKEAARRLPNASAIVQIIEQNHSVQHLPSTVAKSTHSEKSARRSVLSAIVIIVIGVAAALYWAGIFPLTPKAVPVDTVAAVQDTSGLPSSGDSSNNNQPQPKENVADKVVPQPRPHRNEEEVKKGPTTVLFKTFPWCNVYLNYRKIDQTPMQKALAVKPGIYLLGLQNPAYPSFSDSIRIEAHKENIFTYNLDSLFVKLFLTVAPWGNVYIDGKLVGTTPFKEALYVTPEKHILLIRNTYYRDWIDTIDATGSHQIQKHIVLTKKNGLTENK